MEPISVFDMFKIGVGPSSSHTVGPWRAAQRFVTACRDRHLLHQVQRVEVRLYGSLAKTGHGHGTDFAVMLGLSGEDPVTYDLSRIPGTAARVRRAGSIRLGGEHAIDFDPHRDLQFHAETTLPFHPNGITFRAFSAERELLVATYYSIGGGFVIEEGTDTADQPLVVVPHPAESATEILEQCERYGITVSQLVLENERAWRAFPAIRAGLSRLREAMIDSVFRGCHTAGVLPGALMVVRRAPRFNERLLGADGPRSRDAWLDAIRKSRPGFKETLEWVSCFALAVNEENASYGRVVTAPTNGAAGVVPAVLLYYVLFNEGTDRGADDFLLTAAQIGMLFKQGATISAALGGCQAEIGVSSAMAAAGLCSVLGGSVAQVMMAAEIAMEHHLGLTCDPVGGLVQIPCIERNTMGAIKAITACTLALESDPDRARVSLDVVIRSMWETARDMDARYKETAEGGLAVQIPVSLSEC